MGGWCTPLCWRTVAGAAVPSEVSEGGGHALPPVRMLCTLSADWVGPRATRYVS